MNPRLKIVDINSTIVYMYGEDNFKIDGLYRKIERGTFRIFSLPVPLSRGKRIYGIKDTLNNFSSEYS